MTELNALTIAEARDALRKGEVTSVELTEACLKAIDAAGTLNAVVHKTPEIARERARRRGCADQGGDAPAMCGIPVGIKDLFCTEGVPSQAGSKILEGFRPEYESTVSGQLRDAGAVMLGKLNMDEFAMGSSNETSVYGNAVNPWRAGNSDAALTPGGSSGGSAAAVAADLCLGATGTDTGGSIRQPAAFTGIRGPQADLWALLALGDRGLRLLARPGRADDQDGARRRDHGRGDDGHDPKDSDLGRSARAGFRGDADRRHPRQGHRHPARIPHGRHARRDRGALDRGRRDAEGRGRGDRDISLPHTKYALPAYYVIAPAEASSNLARYDGVRYGHRAKLEQGDGVTEMYEKTRAEGFGAEVQRRVMIGTYVLSAGFYDAYYNRARKVRALIKRDFDTVFAEGVDAILTPATPSAAFELGRSMWTR
jgi:aspartyl-tRNA(Asn)/glutamyl-tRNA(Gln) amidotransferase subunit A